MIQAILNLVFGVGTAHAQAFTQTTTQTAAIFGYYPTQLWQFLVNAFQDSGVFLLLVLTGLLYMVIRWVRSRGHGRG